MVNGFKVDISCELTTSTGTVFTCTIPNQYAKQAMAKGITALVSAEHNKLYAGKHNEDKRADGKLLDDALKNGLEDLVSGAIFERKRVNVSDLVARIAILEAENAKLKSRSKK